MTPTATGCCNQQPCTTGRRTCVKRTCNRRVSSVGYCLLAYNQLVAAIQYLEPGLPPLPVAGIMLPFTWHLAAPPPVPCGLWSVDRALAQTLAKSCPSTLEFPRVTCCAKIHRLNQLDPGSHRSSFAHTPGQWSHKHETTNALSTLPRPCACEQV
jgi:hypothetical protein